MTPKHAPTKLDATVSSPGAAGYIFQREDEPTFPGGPYSPPHPTARRLGYAAIGLWVGATATFVNALVTVNLANLSGEAGSYAAELTWLPAVYVAANACANTVLVKARAQFSLPRVMHVLLLVYAVVAALQFVVPGLSAELFVRFVSGLVAGGMTTLGIYYLLQALPPEARPAALVIGLGMTQLGTPLARMLPVDLVSAQGWLGLHCIELAAALTTLALITWLPLPPTPRSRLFEPLDVVTVALLLPGMLLLCGVINRGRLAWWTDTPWLGMALAAAIPLLAAALIVETVRERPLIRLGWLGTREFLAFVLVAVLMRLALAEQTYGSVGLLALGNLDNDQLRTLFAWVIVGMLMGVASAVVTLSERAIPWQIVVAAIAVAGGAWMDSRSSHLTRPAQLYLSQGLIGYGTCLFIGPTIAYGILKVVRLGPAYLVTLVVVFSMTQNVGGLIGSAALGSYQTAATREHLQEFGSRLPVGDVGARQRMQDAARARAGIDADPVVRTQQGAAALVASMQREANVLGFNDVFRAVALLAAVTAAIVMLLIGMTAFDSTRRRTTP